MLWSSFVSIGLGAMLGAWIRWGIQSALNPVFPTLPLGTLLSNLLGGFLIGVFMALTKNHSYMPEAVRLGIITGFLGGLTTFALFSAEAVTLLSHYEYAWSSVLIVTHVGGSVLATIFGNYVVKVLR